MEKTMEWWRSRAILTLAMTQPVPPILALGITQQVMATLAATMGVAQRRP